MKYRTIVADPPWQYGHFNSFSSGSTEHTRKYAVGRSPAPLPYPAMRLEQITALPIGEIAEDDAHLYLWTTQRYLWDAPVVVRAWGFHPSTVLTWCKRTAGALGGAFSSSTEFVVFARRGSLAPKMRWPSTWFEAKRPYAKGPIHSAKPEAFLDIVEQVSPGPYLELFARRNRLGWDTWGNESLEHVELA